MDETAKDQTPELSKICTEDKAANIQREYSSLAMPLSNSCENLNLDTQVKFTLKKARTLDKHTLTDEKLTSPDQIPEYILKTLMIVNYHAREFELTSITKNNNKKKSKSNFDSDESEDDDETNDSNSDENEGEDDAGINPMDGLLWVFHCSDTSLRRDLVIHEGQKTPLVDLASCATSEYGIQLDYDQLSDKFGRILESWLRLGTKEAKSVLKLQMHVPIFADLERKKHCPKRMSKKSNSDGIKDIDEVYKDIEVEKEAQRESFAALDERILRYLNYIAVIDETDRRFHLNKIKHQLDKMSLQVMANLHQQYRLASLNLQTKKRETHHRPDTRLSEKEHLKHLEESISECSFGLEHIFREFAQLYELPDITTIDYAGAAAEMLLSVQPLELLDGDSCYIPLRWFDAVVN